MVRYINIYKDEDFIMDLLAGKYDTAIKKGKMKIEAVYNKEETKKMAKQKNKGRKIH